MSVSHTAARVDGPDAALSRAPLPDTHAAVQPETQPSTKQASPLILATAWHSLAWLVVANAIGVWLAVLLLLPNAGGWLGPYTYGRWMPVHLNFQLYGWLSLPLVAWLLKLYRADREPTATYARAAVLLWSLALTLGAASWLSGHSSGKLFLDWSGYTRVLFPAAIVFLWLVLAAAFARSWRSDPAFPQSALALRLKLIGLALLAAVPFLLYAAANPAIYPPVNPDSGGPTASSQLESVLVIVAILFVLPYGLTRRTKTGARWLQLAWLTFAIEAVLCLFLDRGDISHHRPTQWVALGSLLVWIPLIPAYWSAFAWPAVSMLWRRAALLWWAILVPTGWCLFLPGVLDRLKFTDGLVAHSLLAMAGFVTSLLVLILVMLLGSDGDVFSSRWAFVTWQLATFAYVALMLVSGWIEGADPTFTMVPSTMRNAIYLIRLLLGIAMTVASANWLLCLTQRLAARERERTPAPVRTARTYEEAQPA